MLFRNKLFTILGLIVTGLGVVGIFLPILPTTPFLLLAVFLFTKSNSKMGERLMKNRYLAIYVENYRNKSGIPLNVKVISLTFLWAMLTVSMLLLHKPLFTIILLAVGGGVTIHLLSLKTQK